MLTGTLLIVLAALIPTISRLHLYEVHYYAKGASIIDVDSIGEGGGQPKVNHSIKLLVINESIKGGGGSNNRKK